VILTYDSPAIIVMLNIS